MRGHSDQKGARQTDTRHFNRVWVQKRKNDNKPLKGHFKKSGNVFFYTLKEVGVEEPEDFSWGKDRT
jgi:hypothetical protein